MRRSAGSIAGIPLCCQQRPVPRTRREQGLPLCVRAPHMETISCGSVGGSRSAPRAIERASIEPAASGAVSAGLRDASTGAGGSVKAVSSPRSSIKGGAGGRPARPARKPPAKSATTRKSGQLKARARLNLFSQSAQNLRLVHQCQRARAMRVPQSAQKLGRYIVRNSFPLAKAGAPVLRRNPPVTRVKRSEDRKAGKHQG